MDDNLKSPAPWLLEPRLLLDRMLDGATLMFRPDSGPYLLNDLQDATPIFVAGTAVDFLLERGWLTRIDGAEAGIEGLHLLTAEGRRTGAAWRVEQR